jgi:hypothetical protein
MLAMPCHGVTSGDDGGGGGGGSNRACNVLCVPQVKKKNMVGGRVACECGSLVLVCGCGRADEVVCGLRVSLEELWEARAAGEARVARRQVTRRVCWRRGGEERGRRRWSGCV